MPVIPHVIEIGLDVIELDKVYGPTSACRVRVFWSDGDWVLEREVNDLRDVDAPATWEEMVRFDGQESLEYGEPE